MSERQRSLFREYGRPGGARGLDDLALMEAVGFDLESSAARLREVNAIGERPMAGWVSLPDLISHMDKFYSAEQLRTDLDAVLTLCGSHRERAEVRKYVRARLAGDLPGSRCDLGIQGV